MNAPITRAILTTEAALQRFAMDLIRMCKRDGVVAFHPANEAKRTAIMGHVLKRQGMVPGASDVVLAIPPDGRMAALELKLPGRPVRPNQQAFMDSVVAAGGLAAVARTPEEVETTLRGWGCLR